jgi:hypothetical protein
MQTRDINLEHIFNAGNSTRDFSSGMNQRYWAAQDRRHGVVATQDDGSHGRAAHNAQTARFTIAAAWADRVGENSTGAP